MKAKTYEELVQENTALAAQLQGPDGFATWKDAAIDERVRRVAAEKREQALAARLQYLRSMATDGRYEGIYTDREVLDEVLSTTAPETSLARLKAEWQAEALHDLVNNGGLGWGDRQAVIRAADKLRRQAEGGE